MPASELEKTLLFQVHNCHIPVPETEWKAVAGRKFRWDLAWPEFHLLVEIQGGTWGKGAHSTGSGLHRDYEKLNLATLAGFQCFMFDSDMVKSGQAINTIKDFFSLYAERHSTESPES